MCEMVAKQTFLSPISDSNIYSRILSCVDQFCNSNYSQGIKPEMLTEFYQPMTLIESLVNWVTNRYQSAQTANLNLDNVEY